VNSFVLALWYSLNFLWGTIAEEAFNGTDFAQITSHPSRASTEAEKMP
jgi:hypothetical protein